MVHGDLPRLTALDLCIDLVSARVEQVDGLVLELPDIAVVTQVYLLFIDALTRNQLRGFEPYCLRLCYHRLRLCRAGRQAEADQPNYEQPGCCA